ncbi:Phosphotransferase [Rhodovastum atsumiense]|nr:phosphotransferase [Rhodovastum atsumiense]CAH2599964.1 Phosphotransferase [Rhodovastum atsumiense]
MHLAPAPGEAPTDLLSDPLMAVPPPDLPLADVHDVLARAYGLSGKLVPLGGERDRNFRLTPSGEAPVLVKFAHPEESAGITNFQTEALLHLEAADPTLPVPRMRRSRDGATSVRHPLRDGRHSLLRVLSFLPGQPMPPGADAAGGQAHALGMLTARLDRALEGFAHAADRRRLLWDLREAPGLRPLLDEVADPALRDLAAAALARFEAEAAPLLARLPTQVIHNDLNPHNVLVDPEDSGRLTGIIDFGDMVRAPRLQEIATTAAYLLRAGNAPFAGPAAFLAGYRRVLPVPPAEAAMLPALIATRMTMTVLITSWRARRQPENAAYILRNVPGARAGLESLARLPLTALLPDEE